jgi:thymidylate synthase ThyX
MTSTLPNISARIVGHSINPAGIPLCSFVLRYPRMIHAELMTHRVFSRNAASSRAIPLKRMIAAVEENPARFEYWGSNRPGMQAGVQLHPSDIELCQHIIADMQRCAVNGVAQLETTGLHKQNANRYLEPFGHITTLVTACDWENFFSLRLHKAAQPEFMRLASLMTRAWLDSEPRKLEWGEWHIPTFKSTRTAPEIELDVDSMKGHIATTLKIATARCARLSYLTFDGEHNPDKDIALHDELANAGHWSPFEHCAQAVASEFYPFSNFDAPEWAEKDACDGPYLVGLSHWMQYRKQFPDERKTISREELEQRLRDLPDWAKP